MLKPFLKKIIPRRVISWFHLGQAFLANLIYGWSSRKMVVIGVTGTNGKTTTVHLIQKVLEAAGKSVGVVSTIAVKIGEQEKVNESKMTTLSAFKTQKLIGQMLAAGNHYAVIETSSHAIDQYRVWGVAYDVAVLTNTSHEHLDYHKTMEEYREVKGRLFEGLPKTYRKEGIGKAAILNMDDETFENYSKFEADVRIGYGIKNQKSKIKNQNYGIIGVENIQLKPNGTSFKVEGTEFNLQLLGEFNVYNALAAIGVSQALGIEMRIVKQALEKVSGIPGRMDKVEVGQDFTVIIDYAVTPDSLEKLYQTIQTWNSSPRINVRGRLQAAPKIIAILGSAGERDKTKRPIMGEIVAKYTDYLVLTNEDPFGEDPQAIIDQIAEGVRRAGKIEGENFWQIMDRREAIRKAVGLAGPGDVVVLTGKGVETLMAIGKKRIPWDERKIAVEIIKEKLLSHININGSRTL